MKKFNRVFFIVTDSLGIGNCPRAKEFGDFGANTFSSISKTRLLNIPTWRKMGINNIVNLEGMPPTKEQNAYTLRLIELGNAKDTLAGHWEMMGIKTVTPFPTFTETGFPQEMLDELSKAFDGKEIIGNKAASGTEIITELGETEIKEGKVIVYTSADPVLQICGNEETMGLETLYRYGKAAREICNSRPEWNVGRIIVRPYTGTDKTNFQRTANRHDYAVEPSERLVMDDLASKGVKVTSIGKINDIYSGHGIDVAIHSESNNDGMDKLIDLVSKDTKDEFIMVNLVEFDSHYGHRRNIDGYAEAINDFDIKLTKLKNAMKEDDLLIITSDHGNDPSWPGSDHTREMVPGTIFSKGFEKPMKLDDAKGFGTLGNIVAKNWDVAPTGTGEDITNKLK
ncbi:phosphopentomutase [Mycoplasma todarodis]|uniref:Phosphopentomutase n=1 Tax=Mycoplasma todarodis TaxID=1937191 RepID=A0A4R0XSV1_9MOLU|nr:phosphopentomutase [Mycoplasma todarodis]TCG11520.1 phosphopentomutase [Mycoplasma todarodis]